MLVMKKGSTDRPTQGVLKSHKQSLLSGNITKLGKQHFRQGFPKTWETSSMPEPEPVTESYNQTITPLQIQ